MSIVNFEYYKVFYYTAKYGTISRAAEALYVTQPSITKSIQKLESQLDCALFVRTSRGMSLTQEGQVLFDRVGPACETIIKAEDEIYRLKHLDIGAVRLGSILSIMDSILIPDIDDFNRINKNISFEITKHSLATIANMLLDGTLDFSIDFESGLYQVLPMLEEKGLELQVWAGRTVEILPVAGERFRHLVGRELTAEEIAQYPLILTPVAKEEENKDFYRAMFRSGAYKGENDIISDTVGVRIAMARNNMGITFIPLDSVYDYVEAGKLFVLNYDGMLPQKRLVVFRNANKALSIAAQEFLDYLIEREELQETPFPRVIKSGK